MAGHVEQYRALYRSVEKRITLFRGPFVPMDEEFVFAPCLLAGDEGENKDGGESGEEETEGDVEAQSAKGKGKAVDRGRSKKAGGVPKVRGVVTDVRCPC